MKPVDVEQVLKGSRRINLRWPALEIEYSWLPPFDGAAPTRANRIEVVFSSHSAVALEHAGRTYRIDAPPGSMYVVGAEPTTLLHVGEYSDTLEMYPSAALLADAARAAGITDFELRPTLQGQASLEFGRDPVVLGVAHVLRRACMGGLELCDTEADWLAHILAERLLALQYGVEPGRSRFAGARMDARLLQRLAGFIEDNLAEQISLDDLAGLARLSPCHLVRCFKKATGLAPHQYILARRIELAKRLLMTTSLPVREIAWSIGFENLSHFRRQFAAHLGVVPGELRQATQG
jgi:AraC family transcriptional regulator